MVALPPDHEQLVRAVACCYRKKLSRNVDLEDLVQAGQIGLLHALRLYRPETGWKFNTYATHRIRGAMKDWLRAENPRLRPAVVRPRFVRLSALGRSPQAVLAKEVPPDPWDDLEPLLAVLDTKRRVAVMLWYLHRLTMREIGRVLRLKESRVCQLIHSGVEQVRGKAQ